MKKRFLILTILLALLPLECLAKTNYHAKEEITINEDYKSSLFLAGQEVEVLESTNVDGISVIASTNTQFEGTTEHLVSVADELKIRGKIKKDTFFAVNKISSYGILNRDLYGIANNVYLSNKINGNIKLFATSIKLEDIVINKNISLYAENIEFGENVEIKGTLQYNDNAVIKGMDNAQINKLKTYTVSTKEISISSKLMDILSSVLNYILIGIVLLYVTPKLFNKKDFDISYIGIGSLVLLLAPFILIFMLLTPFAISLGFILLALFVITVYISSIITSFVVGNYINRNMLNNKDSKYVSLIIGIIAIKLLSLMPIIGGIITVASVLYGLGYIFSEIKKIKK